MMYENCHKLSFHLIKSINIKKKAEYPLLPFKIMNDRF